MATNELDQDVVRWGLNFLDFSPFFNLSYGCGYNPEDDGIYHGQYMRDYCYDSACNTDWSYIESDAILAETLQEEFSQLEVAAEPSHTETQQFHSSNVASDWLVPASVNYYPVYEETQEEANDAGYSSSCSSPRERSYDGEDYIYSLELTDESELDGELGKRLNQMIPMPHVPRINGEIPTMDEATTDHQRLLDRGGGMTKVVNIQPLSLPTWKPYKRHCVAAGSSAELQLYDLVERKVQGDGNCQFRALSDQFYRSPEHHKFIRQQVVDQLKCHPDFYEGYVPMEYGEYLKKMARSGEWGDHVSLQAAADTYGVKIFLITSFKSTCYMEIIPKIEKSKRVIFLSFWAEVHYNSIYPQGELPSCEPQKKKNWWRLGKN